MGCFKQLVGGKAHFLIFWSWRCCSTYGHLGASEITVLNTCWTTRKWFFGNIFVKYELTLLLFQTWIYWNTREFQHIKVRDTFWFLLWPILSTEMQWFIPGLTGAVWQQVFLSEPDKGEVFVWGYGILGKGPKLSESSTPEMIPPTLFGRSEFNPSVAVSRIRCGLNHFAAVTGEELHQVRSDHSLCKTALKTNLRLS